MFHRARSVTLAAAFTYVLAIGTEAALAQHAGTSPPLTKVPAALAGKVKLDLVTTDTTEAVAVVAVPGEAVGRLFVVEKRGRIRILRGKTFEAAPFLDISSRVSLWPKDNGEQGLLGMVFHPQYTKNGRFYINFTDLKGDTRILELRVDPKNPSRADPSTEKQILWVAQPYSNHNAGDLAFGPDGKLYVLLGDGGKADDPHGHGQNPKSLLSKVMRIDVNADKPAPEVIGKGLRNPWRYSFDRETGDLYIADVGQNLFEYVHVLPASKGITPPGPFNFGWNIVEGFHCFEPRTKVFGNKKCKVAGLTPPLVEYPHTEGCSITGGYVYRGKAIPDLRGTYFYSDYCTALLRSFRLKDGKATDSFDWKAALDPDSRLARIASFGEDQDGELYLVTHEGPIYKFAKR